MAYMRWINKNIRCIEMTVTMRTKEYNGDKQKH